MVEGLPVAQPDVSEEVKGPRVGAPDQAMDGFLRKTGLTREALVERDGLYFGHIHKSGRPTAEIIAELVEQAVAALALRDEPAAADRATERGAEAAL